MCVCVYPLATLMPSSLATYANDMISSMYSYIPYMSHMCFCQSAWLSADAAGSA